MSSTMTMMEQQQGPNLRSQDVRFRRLGGDQPYRDDPSAPQSRTPGGIYGPIDPDNHKDSQNYKRFSLSSSSSSSWIRCCCPQAGGTTTMRAGSHTGSSGGSSSSSRENDPHYFYYQDDFNDLSWTWKLGTSDEDGIWINRGDPAGTIMAGMVWILLGYSILTITFLAQTGGIAWYWSWIYSMLCCMALGCHVKTSLTDPGSVPHSAVPTEEQRRQENRLSMCSQCQTFKPPASHHCRICNRCISRMDHHCPWMNNCVGAGNLKHFFLFLIYTWLCCVFALILMGSNYFFCSAAECEFNIVLTQLVRLMTILSICAFLFTSSMIMNVIYGIMTGIGTIDRLKKKATNTMTDSEEEPIPLKDIFGIGPWWTWAFPMDPIFEDYDRVMGYATPQRLLREQMIREQQQASSSTPQNGRLQTPTQYPPV